MLCLTHSRKSHASEPGFRQFRSPLPIPDDSLSLRPVRYRWNFMRHSNFLCLPSQPNPCSSDHRRIVDVAPVNVVDAFLPQLVGHERCSELLGQPNVILTDFRLSPLFVVVSLTKVRLGLREVKIISAVHAASIRIAKLAIGRAKREGSSCKGP